jgi:hypothetical protein
MESPVEPGNESAAGHGGEESPSSNTSLDSESDSGLKDQLPAQDFESAPAQPFRVVPVESLKGAQTAAMAHVIASSLNDVEFGKYLPDDMPRERREMIIKAEALWAAGTVSVDEIARVVQRSKAAVYDWSARYHWKKRADIAQLGQEALRRANMMAIAARARAAVAAMSANPSAADGAPAPIETPDGAIDLLAARAGRPMSEADAVDAAIVQQSVANAHQDSILSLFVQAISKIVEDQQQTSNLLVAHLSEMAADLKAAYDQWKANLPKTGNMRQTSKEVREEVAKQLPLVRQLTASLTQAIALQRRVWMIGDAGKGGGDDSGGDGLWDGGLERTTGPGVPIPVPRETYEASVLAAERQGIDLTKRGGSAT